MPAGHLDTLPARAADIPEIARVDGAAAGADELDVVGEVRAVDRGAVERLAPIVPRAPNSYVVARTGCSGGSATKMFGSVQGAFGSAHVSSTGEGTRIPWLTPPKTLSARPSTQVRPGRGIKAADKCWSR